MTDRGVAPIRRRGRGGKHAVYHLAGFSGILQVDGYAAYNSLVEPAVRGRLNEAQSPQVMLAFCWSHFRRRFYDIAKGGNAPIASEALLRISQLYQIDDEIRGQSTDA